MCDMSGLITFGVPYSDRVLDMTLWLEDSAASNAGLMWSGVSGRPLSRLDPGASILLNLCLIPLAAGLQVSYKY